MYRDLGHNWNGHQISGKIHWKKSTSHRQKVRLPNSGITNLETRSILLFYFVQCANMQVLEGCALPSKKRLITEIKYIQCAFCHQFRQTCFVASAHLPHSLYKLPSFRKYVLHVLFAVCLSFNLYPYFQVKANYEMFTHPYLGQGKHDLVQKIIVVLATGRHKCKTSSILQ